MNEENGLDLLAEAFVKLKKKDTVPNLRLRIGGGYTGKDKPFLRKIRKILDPYQDYVVIDEGYRMEEHARFYREISVLSVPLRLRKESDFICVRLLPPGGLRWSPLPGLSRRLWIKPAFFTNGMIAIALLPLWRLY